MEEGYREREERGQTDYLWGIPCPHEPQDTLSSIAHWSMRHLPIELEKVLVGC